MFIGLWRRQGSSRETPTSASLNTLKLLIEWITTSCGKFWKRWKYKTTLLFSWETCLWVKKQQLELNRNNWLEQVWESNFTRLYIVTFACLTYMQSLSYEMPGWMNHKVASRLPGEISTHQIYRWYHTNGRK